MTITTPTNPPEPQRKWLHRSSWCVACLVLLVGVVFNVGGDYWYFDNNHEVHFGMPWVYGIADAYDSIHTGEYQYPNYFKPEQKPSFSSWWRIDTIETFKIYPLLWNFFVWLGITCVVSWLWELRRRKLKAWYQYRLIDWLWLCVVLALGYGFHNWLYKDARIWRKICQIQQANLLQHPNVFKESPVTEYIVAADIPHDWFWEMLGVPTHRSPFLYQHDFSIKIIPQNQNTSLLSPVELPILSSDLLEEVVKIKNVDYYAFTIQSTVESPLEIEPKAFHALKSIRKDQELYFHLHGDVVSGQMMSELSELPNIDRITIENSPNYSGDNLQLLREVKAIDLFKVKLNAQGISNLGQLDKLQRLLCDFEPENCLITGDDWKPLIGLKQLQWLSLRIKTVDKELLECIRQLTTLKTLSIAASENSPHLPWNALAGLSQLKNLGVYLEGFDDAALAQLTELPQLERLSLKCNNLTSSSLESLKKIKTLKIVWLVNNKNTRAKTTDINIGKSKKIRVNSNADEIEIKNPQWTPENEEDFNMAVGGD